IGNLRNAYVVIDHELSKFFAIDQNDLLLDTPDIFNSILCEFRGRDEYAFACSVPFQTAGKCLDARPAYGICVFPTLCLHVNDIESQFVFLNDALYSAVPTSAECL